MLAALKDADAADEVFQEFALRLVRGDFRRADPQRGRFRDFVKTALINMVINYRKKKGRGVPLEKIAEPTNSQHTIAEVLAVRKTDSFTTSIVKRR